MNDLRDEIRAFCKERDWDQFHTPKNLATALMVEAAEIAEHFQWLTPEESQSLPPEKRAEVEQEVADVLTYLVNLADRLGIDPIEAARKKMEINRRKYPADRVRGKSDKYNAYEKEA